MERIPVIGKGQARTMALEDIMDETRFRTTNHCCEGGKMHVREFQDVMRRIYFHRDSERGVTGTFQWLVEEANALGETIKKKMKAMEDQFADVFAWLASLANVINVDLEKAVIAKYDNTCSRCE